MVCSVLANSTSAEGGVLGEGPSHSDDGQLFEGGRGLEGSDHGEGRGDMKHHSQWEGQLTFPRLVTPCLIQTVVLSRESREDDGEGMGSLGEFS